MEELIIGSELAYGHWGTVAFNTIIWSAAAYLLIRPERPLEHVGIALFGLSLLVTYAESYGYPFTLSLFAGQLASYAGADHLGWRAGDLWRVLFETSGREGAFDWFHIIAGVLIFGGLIVLFLSRKALEAALASGVPATGGPYRWVRHPQYLALYSIMLGNLVQSPALLTLLLFPVLIYLYAGLARREEQELLARFGPIYEIYCGRTPRFMR
ncbi:MAG: methyltransferase family protein [Gammaproteobacteria bacterium]